MAFSTGLQNLRNSPSLRSGGSILVWGIVPLLIGWLLAIYFIPQPAVGFIQIRAPIFGINTEIFLEEIKEAREDPRIKAIVVQINSPGGASTDGQAIYLELLNLRHEKPVVGSIDSLAASAAYRIAVATDPIFAKPGSLVGNVGTIASFPSEGSIDDVILTTGPFKQTASNSTEFVLRMEGNKQHFLATVFSQRGEHLTLTPTELSQGLLYSGYNAVELGLIDQIGSETEAIETAAELAGLANYEVVDLEARAIENIFGDSESEQMNLSTSKHDLSNYLGVDEIDTRMYSILFENTYVLFEIWPGAIDLASDEPNLPGPSTEGQGGAP